MKKSLLALSILLGVSGVAQAELITNGDFEDYDVAGNSASTWAHVAVDCSTAGTANCIEDDGTIYSWEPYSGAPNEFVEVQGGGSNQFVELNPAEPGGITQSFNALAGLGTLSWEHKARNSGSSLYFDYEVWLNGVEIYDSTDLVGAPPTSWTLVELAGLNLLAGENTLSFFSTELNTNLGAHIDDVSFIQTSVAAVPEPQTYAMFLLGLGLLGFATRQNKAN